MIRFLLFGFFWAKTLLFFFGFDTSRNIKNSILPALLTTASEKILARGLNPEGHGHTNPNPEGWKKNDTKMVEICNCPPPAIAKRDLLIMTDKLED